LFIILQGKSYYTAGIYPLLIAAGAVFFEKILKQNFSRAMLVIAILLLEWLFLPMGKPIYSTEDLVKYFDKAARLSGTDAIRRDENNQYHKLPQDYSDMLGWNELTELTYKAWQMVENKNNCVIYAENYGEASAISIIGKKYNLPNSLSFSDNFRYWIPQTFPNEITQLIYINHEVGEDIQELFADIQEIGKINDPLAREYGLGVFLCRNPRQSFNAFWKVRIQEVIPNQ
jgi:hypothetical protein